MDLRLLLTLTSIRQKRLITSIPYSKVMYITEEQFLAYEEIRQSGITNMFDTKAVCALSGLSKEVVLEIMKQYDELSLKHMAAIERMATISVHRGISL